MNIDLEALSELAISVRRNAYAPFSKFSVGAAILSRDGQTYQGVNVENSSYGLTLCAERVAVSAAVAAGVREFAAIAIATEGGHAPCGACRQFLNDFERGEDSMVVLLIDTTGKKPPEETTLATLLPRSFRLDAEG